MSWMGVKSHAELPVDVGLFNFFSSYLFLFLDELGVDEIGDSQPWVTPPQRHMGGGDTF